jgi:exopolysaccharide biosynthesis predicted pyruvyltransferase EpsI
MMLPNHSWQVLETELRQLMARGRPIRFVTNPGNAGDGLIAAGTWQLFDQLNLRPVVSKVKQVARGDIAIYSGGGNLVPEYPACREFLERCLAVGADRVLILPHTIRGHEGLLASLDERFTLVCRDTESLERVRVSAPGARVIQAPDLALCLDVRRLRESCRSLEAHRRFALDLVANGQAARYFRWRRTLRRLKNERSGTLYVLRADAEAPVGASGDPRWDISKYYISKFRSRYECDFVSRDILDFMEGVPAVVTNRLHVGIAGALMGKQVTFRDNSYGKIRAVFNTSLRGIQGLSLTD